MIAGAWSWYFLLLLPTINPCKGINPSTRAHASVCRSVCKKKKTRDDEIQYPPGTRVGGQTSELEFTIQSPDERGRDHSRDEFRASSSKVRGEEEGKGLQACQAPSTMDGGLRWLPGAPVGEEKTSATSDDFREGKTKKRTKKKKKKGNEKSSDASDE